ncbi:hypothetical protein T4B_12830 [Trichinella pseudospiralis]|uniref:Uncharacterized protein n=1 Tax=Trichinella pseudospiralis TaxID=6337 RepID=A0A0V1GSK5_TRIPS|nr:hypothetical protein T4C_9931 [Trichinella pseudospiralis]KRZ01303.1 hypothetical protein T4B_12830 [Trichinella pseudospiralis]
MATQLSGIHKLNAEERCALIIMVQVTDIQHERFSEIFLDQRAYAFCLVKLFQDATDIF